MGYILNIHNGGLRLSSIYCIECIVNQKKYIGSTTDYKTRFRTHKSKLRRNCHDNDHLQNAWNKYGEKNFSFFVLENNISDEILIDREVYWIEYCNTLNDKFGYNLREELGGGARRNSAETRRKISESNKGRTVSDETRYKLSEANKGKVMSDSARIKMSISKQNMSEETKKKMSENHADTGGEKNGMYGKKGKNNPNYGKSRSEEVKYKISEAQQGEKNHNAKLTEIQAIEIIGLLKQSELTLKEIANMYSVSISAINGIKRGTHWKHLLR